MIMLQYMNNPRFVQWICPRFSCMDDVLQLAFKRPVRFYSYVIEYECERAYPTLRIFR